jgi:hypothetical protein
VSNLIWTAILILGMGIAGILLPFVATTNLLWPYVFVCIILGVLGLWRWSKTFERRA